MKLPFDLFVPGLFFIFFSFLLIYAGLWVGVWGLGSWIEFSGVRISVDGALGRWCEAFWFFWGWGSLC